MNLGFYTRPSIFSGHWVTTCCLFQRTFSTVHVLTALLCKTRGPFLEGPENFLHPESHSKISNLMITELFYSHIFKMNRSFLHARRFGRVRFSTFRYRYQNGFTGPKSFRHFRETGPRLLSSCHEVSQTKVTVCFSVLPGGSQLLHSVY